MKSKKRLNTDDLPTRQIVLNRIITPDGTELVSRHRHDYKTYVDTVSGEEYMVDGGDSYLRRNLCKTPHTEASVYTDSPFEEIRSAIRWGTFGKSGNEAMRWVLLKDMSDDHIQAILDTQGQIEPWRRQIFRTELSYRKNNNIEVRDGEETIIGNSERQAEPRTTTINKCKK